MLESDKNVLLAKLSAEHASVQERFQRLDRFIMSEQYVKLPEEERMDLSAQWRHMYGYVSILDRRMDRLKGQIVGS